MRNGTIVIVPIFIAIALMFWAIWFMGQEASNTKTITNIEQLQKLQQNAIIYAIERRKQILQQKGANELTPDEEAMIEAEIQNMMKKNGVK